MFHDDDDSFINWASFIIIFFGSLFFIISLAIYLSDPEFAGFHSVGLIATSLIVATGIGVRFRMKWAYHGWKALLYLLRLSYPLDIIAKSTLEDMDARRIERFFGKK